MSSWNEIYTQKGIVQKSVMPVVYKFVMGLSGRAKPFVLDSGCGTGRHSMFVLDSLNDVHVEAIDASEKAVSIFKRNVVGKNCIARVCDLNQGLDYPEGFFDGVISTLVVEHGYKGDVRKWCGDMDKVLKPGGLIAFAVPSTLDPRYLTGKEVEPGTRIDTQQEDGNLPHHFFGEGEVESLFTNYSVRYKNLQSRNSDTAKVIAKHWEYLLQKP